MLSETERRALFAAPPGTRYKTIKREGVARAAQFAEDVRRNPSRYSEFAEGARRRPLSFAEPQPPANLSPSQVRVISPILTDIALGYRNMQFVGGSLFPRVPVNIRGGQILQFGMEDFKSFNAKRAPGANTQTVSFGYQGAAFALLQDALNMRLPREYQQDAEVSPGIDLGSRAVRRLMSMIYKSLEVDQAGLATNLGNYGGANQITLSGTSQWDNAGDASNDPVALILDNTEVIRQQIGTRPNVGLFTPDGWIAFCRHPIVRDQYKYTTAESVTEEMVARLLKLAKVVLADSITADDLGNTSDIWGNNFIMAYVPQQLSALEEPSYGYTYTYAGTPYAETPWWDADAKSWVYGVTMDRLPALTGISAGFIIANPSGASD